WRYGEERRSRRVAHAIVEQRKHKRIETTGELAEIVRRAVGPSAKDESDPATRAFQALRIAVNGELGALERGLAAAEEVLAPGGLSTLRYKVQDLEEKIDRTNQKIIESQQATHILKIEWAHLNEAERIERLAKQHLKLEPATITQEIRLDALKTMPSQQRRDAPLPSPPRTGNDVPSSVLP